VLSWRCSNSVCVLFGGAFGAGNHPFCRDGLRPVRTSDPWIGGPVKRQAPVGRINNAHSLPLGPNKRPRPERRGLVHGPAKPHYVRPVPVTRQTAGSFPYASRGCRTGWKRAVASGNAPASAAQALRFGSDRKGFASARWRYYQIKLSRCIIKAFRGLGSSIVSNRQ
jgi:hypothetical protein